MSTTVDLSTAEVRSSVADRDGWSCRFCGQDLVPPPQGRDHTAAEAGTIATLDHWVPRSRGGSWELANLVLACRACNQDKGTLTGPEFLAVFAYRRRQVDRAARRDRRRCVNHRPLVRGAP